MSILKRIANQKVEWKRLGDVCEMKYGKGNTIPKNGGFFPVYGANGIVGNTNEFNNENSAIVGHIGSAGIVVWGENKHFVTYNGTIVKDKFGKLLNKYIYYFLSMKNLKKYVKGNQTFLSINDFSNLEIQIPSLPIQHFLVRILDKFDKLTNDISGLLPHEIELREKQYEYHRDKLLAFRKA